MKCCSHPNTWPVPGKKKQPGSCWISLFSVLRKMIILTRQTWKEGEYFALLILLETNNLFGKWCLFLCCFCFVLWNRHWSWCYFVLRILQAGNRNKAILTIVIGLKNILHYNLVKFALDKEDKSVPVIPPYLIFYL